MVMVSMAMSAYVSYIPLQAVPWIRTDRIKWVEFTVFVIQRASKGRRKPVLKHLAQKLLKINDID
jgi:hypothetical protein